jgi:AcrR family transcriptional regulator
LARQDGKAEPTAPGRDATTKEAILDAALLILGKNGFQHLTTRAIAREARVNQALINYHFGTKEKLLLELMAVLESGKYGRQWNMYHEPDVPLSERWRQAVEFYRKDLDDGFVRMTQELLALSATNTAVAERCIAILGRWCSLLEEAASTYLPGLGLDGRPDLVASAVVSFWLGMGSRILAGESEENGHFFELLDRIGDWLEERERQTAGDAATYIPRSGVAEAKD